MMAQTDAGQSEYLSDIVELQRTELTRLLRENRRLNDRVDQLVQLQEREQVLREQMQETIDRLTERNSGRRDNATARPSDLENRLQKSEQKLLTLKLGVARLVSLLERQPLNDIPPAAAKSRRNGAVRTG